MTLSISIIGLGMAVDAHALSILDLDGRVTVRWAAARSEERCAAFRTRYPFPTTTDVEMALTDPAVDAVVILTPPGTHLELAERALAAGKHLLVEKPLEIDSKSAQKLVEAARAAGRSLGVVLQHRLKPASLMAERHLAAGTIGAVQAASLNVPWWRAQTYYDEPGRGTLARDGGGALITQAIHFLDLFRALVGVEAITAAEVRTTAAHRLECEDYASALMRLGNGAPASMTATTAHFPQRPEQIDVIGERGTLTITGNRLDVFRTDNGIEPVDVYVPAQNEPKHEAHRLLIADFADAIAAGRAPKATGEDALATQLLIEQIIALGRSGNPGQAAV